MEFLVNFISQMFKTLYNCGIKGEPLVAYEECYSYYTWLHMNN